MSTFKFRPDLQCFQYDEHSKRATVVLKDPLSGKFYYLSQFEYRFLQELDGTRTLEEIMHGLADKGHFYSEDHAKAIVGKAAQLGLLLGTKFSSMEVQKQMKSQFENHKKTSRFSSVYFLFIPLINPDKFLVKTLWIVRFFASKLVLGSLLLALPGALYLLISGLQKFQHTFLFFFNLENLLYLWMTLAFIKLIHEFAHAYTAKSYGLHVPQMGVAFLIFFPCLFCNTTDAWQLANRKQRIAISAAGIIVEGAIAIIATYIWYFSQPGVVNSIAFYLMAISFISTILFNGNPLMRFDGYFMLMDFLRIPNLSTRATSYIKYLFMNQVLGLPLSRPASTPKETLIFTVYGISAFLYRIFLYCSIVLGVYYRFDKVLGVMLGLLAFILFIIRPIAKSIFNLWSKREHIKPKPLGVGVICSVLIIALIVLLVPISSKSSYPCYFASAKTQKLTVPLQASVDKVFIEEGAKINEGELLFTLDSSRLQHVLAQKEIQSLILQKEVSFYLMDEKQKERAESKRIEIAQLENEIRRIRRDYIIAREGVKAPFSGIVTKLDSRLQKGFCPGDGIIVGELEADDHFLVKALISEKDIQHIDKEQSGIIYFNSGTDLNFGGNISDFRLFSERDLKDLPFSSRHGGELATETKSEGDIEEPLNAQFQCSVALKHIPEKIPFGMTGRLIVSSNPQSLMVRIFQTVSGAFNKESLM